MNCESGRLLKHIIRRHLFLQQLLDKWLQSGTVAPSARMKAVARPTETIDEKFLYKISSLRVQATI